MCNLIARFWDVNAGKITIGGTDVRDFKLDSLMKNISMVFQSVYLFADTIENNIKFGCPDATHEQVVEAAKKACCHNFISALPDGYDTVIGEGGGSLVRRRETADFHRPRYAEGRTYHHFGRGNKQR